MNDGATAAGRWAPSHQPPPHGDSPVTRELLWYEFGAGCDDPSVPSWMWAAEPPIESHTAPPSPACVRDARHAPLPRGTAELLGALPFPHGRAAVSDPDEALARALVASFGTQWYEPENVFNPHRGYASPRCLYPVQVFVDDGERWHLLEPERHSLTALTSGSHHGRQRRIVLTGRYTRIPRAYKTFRGSLVNLELGITLRCLALALELFGLSGRLALPHRGSTALLDELGLTPAWEWSLPLVVELGPQHAAPCPDLPDPTGAELEEPADDPALRHLVRMNRAHRFDEPAAPVPPAVPARPLPTPGAWSWAELMWRRNSGRMPRRLYGMSGRRTRMPVDSVRDAIRWLGVPPPGRSLSAVSELVTLTAVIQDVEGLEDGVYRVRDGEVVLLRADRTAAARLEAEYEYSLSPEAGCDIRNASVIWFMSLKPRALFRSLGPSGWSAAQHYCGWALHGLCLSTTAYGMFTRPVRAFKETPTRRVLQLDPDEMIALSAVAGAPRYPAHAQLDIRV